MLATRWSVYRARLGRQSSSVVRQTHQPWKRDVKVNGIGFDKIQFSKIASFSCTALCATRVRLSPLSFATSMALRPVSTPTMRLAAGWRLLVVQLRTFPSLSLTLSHYDTVRDPHRHPPTPLYHPLALLLSQQNAA